MVTSLVDKAMAARCSSAVSSAQQGKAQRKKGSAAAAPDSSQVAQSSSANTANAAKAALLGMMREAEGCGQLALSLIIQKAKAPTNEVGSRLVLTLVHAAAMMHEDS